MTSKTMNRKVIWPTNVRRKLMSLRSRHFTAEETYDFVIQLILETEDILLNPILSRTYTEEEGEYKGFSRMTVRGFRIYYQRIDNVLLISAIKVPGEK